MNRNLRQLQTDAIISMLHFNSAQSGKDAHGISKEVFKVLVIDDFCLKIVATLLHTDVLRQHGVTLVLAIDKAREPITDAPVVYLIRSTTENADAVTKDLESGLYKEAHLNFVSSSSQAILERIADGMVKAATASTVAKVFDQYISFISLEQNLFTLALQDSYMQLNDSKATDQQLEAAVSAVVDGLFSVCATMTVVPKIRCASGGLAEHVARKLGQRMVQQLQGKGSGLLLGGVGSTKRPLLCIFDRNFDLTPMAEQPFTYKTLVHDCLGMHLNKVELPQSGSTGGPSKNVSIEITANDAFWQKNGHQEFGTVVAEIDSQLKKYQEVIESITSRSKVSSSSVPDANESKMIEDATKQLLTTVKSVPELREQKKKLDSHMNLLYALLQKIKARMLDKYHEIGQNLLSGSAGIQEVKEMITGTAGDAEDKLRFAILYLLVSDKVPPDADIEAVQGALQNAKADVEAFNYVLRMRKMNLTGPSMVAANSQSKSGGTLLGLVDSSLMSGLAGQVGKQLTKLVGGTRQALVVSTVAQLMDSEQQGKGSSGSFVDSFVSIDPLVEVQGQSAHLQSGSQEAIVFIVGGGNYLEHERLVQWGQACTPKRHILYGATELLTGSQFCSQLASLGKTCAGL